MAGLGVPHISCIPQAATIGALHLRGGLSRRSLRQLPLRGPMCFTRAASQVVQCAALCHPTRCLMRVVSCLCKHSSHFAAPLLSSHSAKQLADDPMPCLPVGASGHDNHPYSSDLPRPMIHRTIWWTVPSTMAGASQIHPQLPKKRIGATCRTQVTKEKTALHVSAPRWTLRCFAEPT